MSAPAPHYVLFSESSETSEPGRWRFVLRARDGSDRFVADDVEPDARGERLELLTVVRGLEALDQPSRVTLMTPSAYVRQGIRYGLSSWRANGWHWESFGQMVPIKDCDLWQRVDRALGFHRVECRSWRIDPPHGSPPGPSSRRLREEDEGVLAAVARQQRQPRAEQPPEGCRHGTVESVDYCKRRVARAWRSLVSFFWLS